MQNLIDISANLINSVYLHWQWSIIIGRNVENSIIDFNSKHQPHSLNLSNVIVHIAFLNLDNVY